MRERDQAYQRIVDHVIGQGGDRRPQLPKPHIERLTDTSAGAYTTFKRSFLTIMETRPEWNQAERKAFLKESIAKEAASMIVGIDFSIADDVVTWQQVLLRVDNVFLSHHNTLAAQEDFRNCKQKSGEKALVFAGRLRELHERAFSNVLPTNERRETDVALRTQFVAGLRSAAMRLGLSSHISTQPTLARLAQQANDLELLQRMTTTSLNAMEDAKAPAEAVASMDTNTATPKCLICSKIGHDWRECFTLQRWVRAQLEKANTKVPAAFMGAPTARQKGGKGKPRGKGAPKRLNAARGSSTFAKANKSQRTGAQGSVSAVDQASEVASAPGDPIAELLGRIKNESAANATPSSSKN